MWKRVFLSSMLLIFTLLPACTGKDDSNKAAVVYKVGVLNFAASMLPCYEGLKDGFAELGYVEGENITYIYHYSENTAKALLEGANYLLEQDIDLFVALATPSALAAQQATKDSKLPVLFLPINDPVSSQLVESLNKPDGNLTGIRVGGFIPKQLEWLLKIAPNVKTIFAPYNPDDNSSSIAHDELIDNAMLWDVTIIAPEVTTPEEVLRILETIPQTADALFLAGDAMLLNFIDEFVAFAIERKIPLSTFSLQHVERGALMSFGFEFYPVGKQAARLGLQLLEGADPANLPVETADFILSLNLVTADAIGLTIPDDILRQAGNIIRP